MLRALDRETHARALRDAGDDARERGHAGDLRRRCAPARACSAAASGTVPPTTPARTCSTCRPSTGARRSRRSSRSGTFPASSTWAAGRISIRSSKSQGWLTAVDASTGAVKWKYRSPRPMVAAVTTTAGNLVMTGELTGDFVVFDARSGDVLYRFNTGGPVGGGVVTYAARRQAVHRRRVRQPVELLGRAKSRLADDRRLRAAALSRVAMRHRGTT